MFKVLVAVVLWGALACANDDAPPPAAKIAATSTRTPPAGPRAAPPKQPAPGLRKSPPPTAAERAQQQQQLLAAMPQETRPPTQQRPSGNTPEEVAKAYVAIAQAMGVTDPDQLATMAAGVKKSVPDALTSAQLCSDLVRACIRPHHNDFEECFARAPACTTATPWASESAPCCQASCAGQYRARFAALGSDPQQAPTPAIDVIFGAPGLPSCMGVPARPSGK